MNCATVISIFIVFFVSYCTCTVFRKCPHKILEDPGDTSRNEIIKLHNRYRKMAVNGSIEGQPKATKGSINMLKWNRKLAQLAKDVAKTCDFKHIEIKTDDFPKGLGQNLYKSCSTKRKKVDWKKAIGDWYKEHLKYEFPDDPGQHTGHYTQVIWGKSKKVGCAHTEYTLKKGSNLPYCILYVCHYVPRGNIKGQPPYTPVDDE